MGTLVLNGATSGATTLTPTDSSTQTITLPATTGTMALTTGQIGMKNRIINGAMVIDQRNAGASVTVPATTVTYTLDRWAAYGTQASKFTVQQNAGSVTPPTGFSNYLGVTSSSAYSIGATDAFWIRQPVEGFNIADLNWGTANAKTVTLSFWVYSSLTGTFGGSISNGIYSYPFSYSIPAANTWTQISVTLVGAPAGTWPTNNTAGLYVIFSLGTGSTYSGTAGSWAAANYTSATGATSVVGTSGATFYITGVQLELGSQATTFDFRSYTIELANCQRYCYALTAATGGTYAGIYVATSSNTGNWTVYFPVQSRVAPTGVTTIGNWYFNNGGPGGAGIGSLAFISSTNGSISLNCNGNVSAGGSQTAGYGGIVSASGGSATFYTTGNEL